MLKESVRIIIAPARGKSPLDLARLLAAIPPDYHPGEIDWGPPVGHEIW